jgi:hypothetical protein
VVGGPQRSLSGLLRSSIVALAIGCGAAQDAREQGGISERSDVSWEQAIHPLFARACTPCHLRAGEAGLDLSTFAAWKSRRADVRRCVVVDKTMPPGHPLSDADRETVRAWIDGSESSR